MIGIEESVDIFTQVHNHKIDLYSENTKDTCFLISLPVIPHHTLQREITIATGT